MTILAFLIGDSKPLNLFLILSSNAEHTSSGVVKTASPPYYNTYVGQFVVL
jgi:hypothetical protein